MPLFPRLNWSEPERVFIVVDNGEGAVMAKDATCQLDDTTALDGVKARYVDQHEQYCFLGIVDALIPAGARGLVQVYGYRTSSNVVRTDTDLAAGMPLTVVTNVQHLAQVATSAATALADIWVIAAESSTSGAGSSVPKIFIRAL